MAKQCYKPAERAYVTRHGKAARATAELIHRKEMQLAADQDNAAAAAEYDELVKAKSAEQLRSSRREQANRFNTRNRDLKGRAFWSRNKVRGSGSTPMRGLARYHGDSEKYDLEDIATDNDSMAQYARIFYQHLYRGRPDLDPAVQDMLASLLTPLPLEMQQMMGARVTVRECLKALRVMATGRAGGPDLIICEVYKQHPEMWARILTAEFNASRRLGVLPEALRQGIEVLAYKKNDPRLLDNWTALTLLPRAYLCLSMILMLRATAALLLICKSSQRGFCYKRHIEDNCIEVEQMR